MHVSADGESKKKTQKTQQKKIKRVDELDGTHHWDAGPCGGIATAHADADVTLVDLRRTEARGSTFIFFLLPF